MNEIILLNYNNAVLDDEGQPMNWVTLLKKYGRFRNGVSQIRLKLVTDIEDNSMDVIGFLQLDPIDPMKLFWTVDLQTLPVNTMAEVIAVIDPHTAWPNNKLDAPIAGQRYLLLKHLSGGIAWGGLVAHEHDIIEFDGSQWNISFNSFAGSTSEYVLNTRTYQQLHWNGKFWHLSIDGDYSPGYWRLAL
jgi:hypothetical protein